ncbi:MAG: hypothetical protein HY329_26690 [Chloroflexi bacterium]|nr:hypothetical protein [Chloroflexota bacterium]
MTSVAQPSHGGFDQGTQATYLVRQRNDPIVLVDGVPTAPLANERERIRNLPLRGGPSRGTSTGRTGSP